MPGTGSDRETEGLEADRFEVLVRELAPSMYRFALSILRDPHAAEDLVQETFLRGFEQRARFRGESSEATWLRRILHNLAVDAAAVVEHAETREDLEDGLVRPPFIYRSAVVLHDVEGWTMREVAETVGIDCPRPSSGFAGAA